MIVIKNNKMMYRYLFLLSCIFIFNSIIKVEGFDPSDPFENPRPGPSREPDEANLEPLPEDQRCEIDLYVAEIMSLVIAEDVSENGMDYTLEDLYEVLLSYVGYFKQVIRKLTYGPNENDPNVTESGLAVNYGQRIHYFSHRLSEQCSEMMIDGCTEDFVKRIEFMYDIAENKFLQKQELIVKAGQCLKKVEDIYKAGCGKRQESEVDNQPSPPPPTPAGHNPDNIPTYRYSIIPTSLIENFYDMWINDLITANLFTQPNCPIARRINTWLQRLLDVDLSGANPRPHMFSHENNWQVFRENIRRRLMSWSPGGNIFEGPMPRRRGPFFPHFGRDYYDTMDLFEYDTVHILDPNHYTDLITLQEDLLSYIRLDRLQMTHFERALVGFEILISMGIFLMGRPTTPFDVNQWELRQMTENDLTHSRLREQQKQKYLGKHFWVIRKPQNDDDDDHHMQRRSVSVAPENCYGFEGIVRQRWTEFVHTLLNNHLVSKHKNEITPWSEDFLDLYIQYKVSEEELDGCSTANFDSYLYSKIRRLPEYANCLNFKMLEPRHWCYSFRNITLNSDFSNKTMKIAENPIHNDVLVLLRWLVEITTYPPTIIKPVNNEPILKNPFDSEICNISPGLPLITCPNSCGGTIRSRRSVSPIDFYNRVWFKNDKNRVECKCPGSIATITATDLPPRSTTCSGHINCIDDELRKRREVSD